MDRPPPPTDLASATILMLDDDPTMRFALRAALEAAGCRSILQTGNGREALRLVAAGKVDLIICDWQMPAMDGLSFLRALREDPEGAQIPVLMLTVNQTASDAWEAHRLGVAGWVVKPVAPQRVVLQVAATLGLPQPAVPENLLAELVETYEAELPQQVRDLHAMAAAWQPEEAAFATRLRDLDLRMHQVKGQAGTMGYDLLGDLAGLLHDTLRLARENERGLAPHREELVRLGRVATAGMKLVADRRLRGDGGTAGGRMKQQIGEFASALQGKLVPPEAAEPAAARRHP